MTGLVEGIHYHYDAEGNLIFKEFKKNEGVIPYNKKDFEKKLGIQLTVSATGWLYEWSGNGMLQQVTNPHGNLVEFSYDPLGRRIAKQYKGNVTRWVWDGNVPLHEWKYEGRYPPPISVNEQEGFTQQTEPIENMITWLYEEGSFSAVVGLPHP